MDTRIHSDLWLLLSTSHVRDLRLSKAGHETNSYRKPLAFKKLESKLVLNINGDLSRPKNISKHICVQPKG